jgi:hypothetical protein
MKSRDLFFVSILVTRILCGQALTGSLVGTITDSSGGVMPDATVSITDVNTNSSRSTSGNASGNYVFPSVDPGIYRIRVEHTGFRVAVQERVEVVVNSTVRADFQLTLGSVSENVEVTSAAPPLQTDRADTGGEIQSQQMTELPLLYNRNFQGLEGLIPGAGRPFRAHSEMFNSQDSLSFRVNGQSRYSNNVQIEGVDDTYGPGTLDLLIPPAEALATVSITTSNYDAELGRAGGSVTNIVLRSGTNSLHGSLFEFNRVSALSSRNFFANGIAHTVVNQYGFSVGGPIRKDKIFFFGDYQGLQDKRGDINFVTIPTMAFRTGDLTASPTIIYDPNTGNPDGTGRTPFANKQVPQNRISPIATRLLSFLPPPTSPGVSSNFQNVTVRGKSNNAYDIKVDDQLTQNDSLAFRFDYARPEVNTPGIFGLYGGPQTNASGHGIDPIELAGVNYTRILNPSLVATFRVGFSRYMNYAQQQDYGSTISSQVGIPGINSNLTNSGLTGISIDGFGSPLLGSFAAFPWKRGETNFVWNSSWTKVIGNHTVKWGADIRRQRRDLFIGVYSPRGNWTFSAGPTSLNGNTSSGFGNAFASFLLDQPAKAIRDVLSATSNFRSTQLFSYVQDKWQVSPKFTVEVGLRHELYFPYKPSVPGGFSNYDPTTNTLVLAGLGNNPMNMGVKTQWTNFSPRLGLAYRFSDKTVIRAGYGISYTPVIALDNGGWAFNYPVEPFQTLNSSSSYRPAGSLATGFPALAVAPISSNGTIPNAPDYQYIVVPKDTKPAYVQSWNFAIQRSLGAGFILETAYVGNHGVGIQYFNDLNAGLIPGAGAAGQPLFQKFGRQSVTQSFVFLGSNYHSLQVKLNHRFSNGFLLTTAYTYAKALDYSQDNGVLFNNINIRANRAPDEADRTHVFVQSYNYQLPFGPGRRWLQSGFGRWIAGDWQLNGLFTASGGTPLNITTLLATGAGSGQTSYTSVSLNAPDNGNRPNVSGPVTILGGEGGGLKWFDTSAFSAPAAGQFGNVGRSVLRGPAYANLDASLFRRFHLKERFIFELRAEAFNITNTAHFDNPNGVLGNAAFGTITTANPDSALGSNQRNFEFAIKMSF